MRASSTRRAASCAFDEKKVARWSFRLLRLGKGALHESLELGERLGAAHVIAIDEERGRAGNPGVSCDLGIRIDERLVALGVEGRGELGRVEPERRGRLIEGR